MFYYPGRKIIVLYYLVNHNLTIGSYIYYRMRVRNDRTN